MLFTPADRRTLRSLAERVAEIAATAENELICRRWRDVNALRKPDRAPVWCRPVGAWMELLPDDDLRCTDPWARSLERQLRQLLLKHDIGDDEPIPRFFPVQAVFDLTPPNCWGMDIGRHASNSPGGAWSYDPPLRSDADFDRLVQPCFTFSAEKTDDALSCVAELFGDLLPPRLACDSPLMATFCVYAAELRGLTDLLMDMAAEPARVHRLMGYLRDAVLRAMDAAESSGRVMPNNYGPMTTSDPVGATPGDSAFSLKNLWCMANSQELDPVSPAMWEEFYLNYQRPILARYGLVGYGCCENLTGKLDGVLSIPNLRIFVCSAWTNLDLVVERVQTSRAIMWRQKASDVVFPESLEVIKRDLDHGMSILRGCRYQVVLRELQTLAGHPKRLHDWTRLAIDAAERFA